MSPRPSRFLRRPAVWLAAAMGALLAAPLLDAPDAMAQAAKVESQTRPNFGLLLDPPPAQRRRATQHRRWNWREHHRDWRGDHHGDRYWRGRFEDAVVVDCSVERDPFALAHAVERLRPGGLLVLRARGEACVGWLNIDKPLTILGESGLNVAGYTAATPATLRAPDGLPCITVAQGVRVEIRDVLMEAPNARDAACVVGYGAEILMDRTAIRYGGDEAAVFADGGLVDMRNSLIDANTIAAGVVGYGATVTAVDVGVTGANIGFELTPGGAAPSQLNNVAMIAGSSPEGYGPRTMGLLVRGSREVGRVSVNSATICGYSEGLAIEGAFVEVRNSVVCGARKGAVLYSGELDLGGSDIGASDYGVVAGGGRARVMGNRFFGVDQVFVTERAASLEARDNLVYSRRVCEPRRRPWDDRRYRDRYDWFAPDGQGWTCAYDGGSRQFWERGERRMGREYYDYAYPWPEYDAYRAYGGYYDGGGHYYRDDRTGRLTRRR